MMGLDELIWHIVHWLRYDPVGKCAAAVLLGVALYVAIWFFELRKGKQ